MVVFAFANSFTVSEKLFWSLNEPPRPRLSLEREFFLMARPPLLCQGGELQGISYDQRAMASIRFHSSSVTGITERRDIRTSGNDANASSALMAASVTGDFSFCTGTMSMAYSFPVSSAGSGYGAHAASAMPTTAFTSPV